MNSCSKHFGLSTRSWNFRIVLWICWSLDHSQKRVCFIYRIVNDLDPALVKWRFLSLIIQEKMNTHGICLLINLDVCHTEVIRFTQFIASSVAHLLYETCEVPSWVFCVNGWKLIVWNLYMCWTLVHFYLPNLITSFVPLCSFTVLFSSFAW